MRTPIFQRLAARPLLAGALLCVAFLLLASPALKTGFMLDDHGMRLYFQREDIWGGEAHRGPLRVFEFVQPGRASDSYFLNEGYFAWWVAPELRLSFFRPLSSSTHWLDYKVWGDNPTPMLAENMLWAMAGGLAVWALFMTLFGLATDADAEDARRRAAGAALLAAWMWMLDDSRALPVAWISNRNALISLLFGALAVRSFAIACRAGRLVDLPSLGFFALSLLAGESGASTAVWLFAVAICLPHGASASGRPRPASPAEHFQRAALALLAPALLGFAWFLVFKFMGSGSHSSDFYIDPVAELPRFLAALPIRGILLAGSQMFLPPSDLQPLLSVESAPILILIATAVVAVAAWHLFPLLRADCLSRCFAVGFVMSLLPIAATVPNDRLLGFVAIGGAGLLARAFQLRTAPAANSPESAPRAMLGLPRRAVLYGFLVWNAALAPLLLPARIASNQDLKPLVGQLAASFDSVVPADATRHETTLVVLQGPPFFLMNAMTRRVAEGDSLPRHIRTLADCTRAASIERPADNVLILRIPEGWVPPPGTATEPDGTLAPIAFRHIFDGMNGLLRSRSVPFAVGDRVEVTGMTATVQAIDSSGQATAVRFEFEGSLDAAEYVFAIANEWRLEPIELPETGGPPVELPRGNFPLPQ